MLHYHKSLTKFLPSCDSTTNSQRVFIFLSRYHRSLTNLYLPVTVPKNPNECTFLWQYNKLPKRLSSCHGTTEALLIFTFLWQNHESPTNPYLPVTVPQTPKESSSPCHGTTEALLIFTFLLQYDKLPKSLHLPVTVPQNRTLTNLYLPVTVPQNLN